MKDACDSKCDHDTEAVRTETPAGPPVNLVQGEIHKPCGMCFSRAQRREMLRDAKRRNREWYCCARDTRTGARSRSLGKHAHSAQSAAHDHVTGKDFWRADPSATRAVKRRMDVMHFYLLGIAPPIVSVEEAIRLHAFGEESPS